MNLVKNIWRAFTTPSFRVMVARLRMIANKDIKIIPHPTFADDGLISQHISDFMSNDKFLNAYREGVAQGGASKSFWRNSISSLCLLLGCILRFKTSW